MWIGSEQTNFPNINTENEEFLSSSGHDTVFKTMETEYKLMKNIIQLFFL